MATDERVDPYRESGTGTGAVPEPAENATALPEPDAETVAATDKIDTDPANQANPPVPDRDS